MPYERTTEELQADFRMMMDTSSWLLWPRLPVKRYSDGEDGIQVGFLAAKSLEENRPSPIVYLGNCFSEFPKDGEKIEYGTLEDLQMDGWVVD